MSAKGLLNVTFTNAVNDEHHPFPAGTVELACLSFKSENPHGIGDIVEFLESKPCVDLFRLSLLEDKIEQFKEFCQQALSLQKNNNMPYGYTRVPMDFFKITRLNHLSELSGVMMDLVEAMGDVYDFVPEHKNWVLSEMSNMSEKDIGNMFMLSKFSEVYSPMVTFCFPQLDGGMSSTFPMHFDFALAPNAQN